MSIIYDIADRFDLPTESLGQIKLSVLGNRKIMIENHKGILVYERERIEVSGKSLKIIILGDGLDLEAMDKEAVLVRGNIVSVEFI